MAVPSIAVERERPGPNRHAGGTRQGTESTDEVAAIPVAAFDDPQVRVTQVTPDGAAVQDGRAGQQVPADRQGPGASRPAERSGPAGRPRQRK